VVLGQLLAAAGEVLAPSTSTALLDRLLPRWTRQGGPAGAQIEALARVLGVGWRVLPEGGVWLGERPAPLVLPPEATLLRRRPLPGVIEVALPRPWALVPGGTFEGRRVGSVAVSLSPSHLRGSLCLS
jgi:hypothetical protein